MAAAEKPALREKNLRVSKNCPDFNGDSAYSDPVNSAAAPL